MDTEVKAPPPTEIKKRVIGKPFGPDNPPPKSPGRPKKRPVSEAYDDLLRLEAPLKVVNLYKELGAKPGCSWADIVAFSNMKEVIKGNVLASKEFREAIEGKAPQRIELQARQATNIEIAVVFDGPVPERTLLPAPPRDPVIDIEPEKPTEEKKD